ncbi:GyrI-like domain-containing protein [Nonomuraea sp. NN258]|uniref:GyrI-like domain-containing protein n=1 Tax=Nonomuraea antri TaxID=2730852 RepID=UPI00156829AC|nr:GyrI-like domain-containing protein [Nonomuraea antri]NRQ40141.1 GyrI-like domain-containing protein [Nonomuraea antri]
MTVGIEVLHRRPQPVVSVRQTVPIAELTRAQGESLHALWRHLSERGAVPAGPPFVRYHTFDDFKADARTDVEVGVPVQAEVTGAGRVVRGELPGGTAGVTVHLGAHDRLQDAYARIDAWLADGHKADGPAWEVYEWIDLAGEPDPSSWPDPADWRTEIVQPIL